MKAWSASSTSNSSTNGNSEHTEKVAAALLATKMSDKRIISDLIELNQTQKKPTNNQISFVVAWYSLWIGKAYYPWIDVPSVLFRKQFRNYIEK